MWWSAKDRDMKSYKHPAGRGPAGPSSTGFPHPRYKTSITFFLMYYMSKNKCVLNIHFQSLILFTAITASTLICYILKHGWTTYECDDRVFTYFWTCVIYRLDTSFCAVMWWQLRVRNNNTRDLRRTITQTNIGQNTELGPVWTNQADVERNPIGTACWFNLSQLNIKKIFQRKQEVILSGLT